MVQALVQETMEGEMDECLGAGRYMRTDQRLGYRSGYYSRNLLTRVRLILIPPMPGHHTPPSR
jgi:transposase-like protein